MGGTDGYASAEELAAALDGAASLLRAGERERSAAQYLSVARRCAASGRHIEAIGIAFRVLQLDAGRLTAPALQWMDSLDIEVQSFGRSLLERTISRHVRAGRVNEALGLRRRAAQFGSQEAWAWVQHAQLALELEQLDEARTCFHRALEGFDADGNNAELLSCSATMLEHWPDDLEACRALALAHIRLGELERARRAVTTLLRHHPGDVVALEIEERCAKALGPLELGVASHLDVEAIADAEVVELDEDDISLIAE